MIVGVIGSGAIGPDLAYGFVSALAREPNGTVILVDIRQEALDAGMARILAYVQKGLSRGKIDARTARTIEERLVPTREIGDLSDCDYVLEAATENLPIKRRILADLEEVVRPDCLIGFATSGLPRAQIASEARHPDRCFVNHPFFPAWRALPIEVVLSDDDVASERMVAVLRRLGKVPIVTADVECFAADDVFCNYCSEAARIVEEGLATAAQVDRIVNDAVGGGGPFNVLDLTKGNLLTAHCQELMRGADGGTGWFAPPAILTERGDALWHDRRAPGDPTHDDALARTVLDRILAVLLGRTLHVVDNGVCDSTAMNWMTRTALGFRTGLVELAHELGIEKVRALCTAFAEAHPGFPLPPSVVRGELPPLRANVLVERDGDTGVVTVFRPEVRNALNATTVAELGSAIAELEADSAIHGIVLTGWGGPLAGADVMELADLQSADQAREICQRGQNVLNAIAATTTPVVAALDGPVLGGGAELAMACHSRVVGNGLVLGQPEVKLGIIPGYGGSQRLPRLIGIERAFEMLRTGRAIGAREACEWGWADDEPVEDPVAAAKALIRRRRARMQPLSLVDPAPLQLPEELPALEIGLASRVIDRILMDVLRDGLTRPLAEGLVIEIEGVARCAATVDFDIGMKNFIQNGPRVPAVFLHE